MTAKVPAGVTGRVARGRACFLCGLDQHGLRHLQGTSSKFWRGGGAGDQHVTRVCFVFLGGGIKQAWQLGQQQLRPTVLTR